MSSLRDAVAKIEEGLKQIPAEKQAEISKKLNVTFAEHSVYQEAQSSAHKAGRISLDAAQFLYGALGRAPEVFNGQSLATKIAVTQALAVIAKGPVS